MSYSRRMFNLTSLLCVVVLLSGSVTTAPAKAAMLPPGPGGGISGKVSTPGGAPLPAGVVVRLFDLDNITVRGEAHVNTLTGDYSLGPVPSGMYVMKAVPPEISRFTPSLPKGVSVFMGNVGPVNLVLGRAQVQGTVFAPDGVTPAPAEVVVRLGNGLLFQSVTTLSGHFTLGGLPVGSYQVDAHPISDDPYWNSPAANLNITSLLITQTLNLQLRQAQVWGKVVTPQNQEVPLAQVFIGSAAAAVMRKDTAHLSGFFAIGGLVNGTYRMAAAAPIPMPGVSPSLPVTVTIPGATNPYTLTLIIPDKVVSGTVKTNAGSAVSDAIVSAQRVGGKEKQEAPSDAQGHYTLHLAPGLWALTVLPANDSVSWVYRAAPQFVYFRLDNQAESQNQNFTVFVADASISGAVFMPDGISAPPFTVTVSLLSDEGVGRIIKVAPNVGDFSASIPSGSYKVDVFPHDRRYSAPYIAPITIPANGAYDHLNITLQSRDALITGTVSANGSGVAGVPVIAWRKDMPGSFQTLSGPGGLYVLAAAAGEWHVQPAPKQDQPYIYSGAGQDVTLSAGQTATNLDFELLTANAKIKGVLVDGQNKPISTGGWASAQQIGAPAIHNGASIIDGAFTILVPAQAGGTQYRISAVLPPASSYVSTSQPDVTANIGQVTLVTLTVQTRSASISGFLWDGRNNLVVTGVNGTVSAWNAGSWDIGPINPANGAYKLDVFAGLWRLNYRIDPLAGYVKLAGARNIPVQNGQNAVVPLPVAQKDASISGTVYDPNGSPLSNAAVWVKGVGPVVENVWLGGLSDAQGRYTIALPHGIYRLSSAYNQPGWIAPKELGVTVAAGQNLAGQDLHFNLPALHISGTLTVSGTTSGGLAHVWGWSEDGGFVSGSFPVTASGQTASGTYTLNVSGNTTWHLGAAVETNDAYWYGHGSVSVTNNDASLDLTLNGPHAKPAPVVVTFDASTEQTISLADGTTLYIPAGALPTSGQVTLHIVPVATLPHQKHASVLRYGYAFLATDANGQPIEQHFNQDVMITFNYTKAELVAQRVAEQFLRPAYFSTTTNRWTFPDSYVVDTANNQVIMQIDHFTEFALTATQNYPLFAPLITR